jgi:glycosyltransferase involved in cell wall biosynthesis
MVADVSAPLSMTRTEDRTSHRPKFTVVTAVFNGAATLEAAINSLRKQSFRDFEYVVLDGGSTDATVALLEQNTDAIHYWRSEPDSGIYEAWNKGLRVARGEWIAFLGADDAYYPDALAAYAAAIAAAPNVQYVSSRIDLIKDGRRVRTVGQRWSWPKFSEYMTVAHVGSMHHRSLFETYGHFDETYRVCADYELLLRPRDRLRTAFLDATTARMQLGGISNARAHQVLEEQARAKRTSGGRPAWRCTVEQKWAMAKDRVRRLVWY